MKATFGNPKYFRTCGSLFTCGSPMENDANTDWFKGGQNLEKAQAAVQGSPATTAGRSCVLQATNIAYHEQRAPAHRAVAAPGRHQRASWRRSDWGERRHAPRGQDAARPGRLEHLHHLGRRQRDRQPDRARRPCRHRREGLVRLAVRREARGAARQVGGGADAGRAQGGRRASCRRTPGTSCRTSISASGSQPVAYRYATSAAWCRCPRWCRAGTSRRREAMRSPGVETAGPTGMRLVAARPDWSRAPSDLQRRATSS